MANTLGGKADSDVLTRPPHVSIDAKNTCARWWYHPEGLEDRRGRILPKSDDHGFVDFEAMTMTATFQAHTFSYQLHWTGEDLESRLMSKSPSGQPTEFLDNSEWMEGGQLPGAAVAYRLFLRARKAAEE